MLRLAFAVLWLLVAAAIPAAAPPAFAQSPVAIGAPLEGEVVLNRDVEVRIAPDQNARIVLTLKKGKALNALGTPRGTTWTQVAFGGRPIGYVPMDSLDPVYVPRPYSGGGGAAGAPATAHGQPRSAPVAALVPRAAWEAAVVPGAQGALKGLVVATRDIGVTELQEDKRRRHFTLRKGSVAGLTDVANGRLTLALPGRGRVVAGMDGFSGVAGAYPMPGVPPLGPGPVYIARLGEYVSYGEGVRAWTEFTGGPGMEWRDRPPMVWPLFRGGDATYGMGVGPFTRPQIDGACAVLAQRGRDCVLAELEVY